MEFQLLITDDIEKDNIYRSELYFYFNSVDDAVAFANSCKAVQGEKYHYIITIMYDEE